LVSPYFTVVYGRDICLVASASPTAVAMLAKESRAGNLDVGNTVSMSKPKHTEESPFIMTEPTLVQVKK
jgi:hypothetical protein